MGWRILALALESGIPDSGAVLGQLGKSAWGEEEFFCSARGSPRSGVWPRGGEPVCSLPRPCPELAHLGAQCPLLSQDLQIVG